MDQDKFLENVRERLAEISVSGSALRNQGGSGVVLTAREFLKKIDLKEFKRRLIDEQSFPQFLDDQTVKLHEAFRRKNIGNWGTARKALNLFFREVVYNKFWTARVHLDLYFWRKKNQNVQ